MQVIVCRDYDDFLVGFHLFFCRWNATRQYIWTL